MFMNECWESRNENEMRKNFIKIKKKLIIIEIINIP